MIGTNHTKTPEPMVGGFKCIFGGWINKNGTLQCLYVVVFHDYAVYVSENHDWHQQVADMIAQETKLPTVYCLYIYDKKTQRHMQGIIQ